MSIVTIQVGQCGNQVGREFFSNLSQQTKDDSSVLDCFFRESNSPNKYVPRSLLIDMEPKVIQKTISQGIPNVGNLKFNYEEEKQVFYKQSGAGNNWSFGYKKLAPESFFAEKSTASSKKSSKQKSGGVINLLRKEVEKCDSLGGFLLLQSLAGGTGSGVGTYFSERLRDMFPKNFITNSVVWPFEAGEVIVQNYNSVLTLSNLHECSDAIIIYQNDVLSQICQTLLNLPSPSFSDMNSIIADSLANWLLPSSSSESSTGKVRLFYDYMSHLCAHPGLKILKVKLIPQVPKESVAFSSFMWSGLLKHLRQMVIANSDMEEKVNWGITLPSGNRMLGNNANNRICKSLANWVIVRGNIAPSTAENNENVDDIVKTFFGNEAMYSNMTFEGLRYSKSPICFKNQPKTALVLSNSQAVVEPLDRILMKANTLFHSEAYMYQYEKYGITKEDMAEHLLRMEQVLNNYKRI